MWVTYSPYLYVSYFLLKQKRYNKFCHFPLCYSSLRACKHFFLNHKLGTFLLCIFTVCTYLFGWTLNILYPKSISERNPFLMMRVYTYYVFLYFPYCPCSVSFIISNKLITITSRTNVYLYTLMQCTHIPNIKCDFIFL